ncbi:hypothetical protein GBZ48_31605 [Azospirillum melinis]|uniref:Bro-N domain-containing protein n=1 Tax=Azospirillum melinis TaxID=328839 RepID=A0ABX2KM73_9PROT|nr:BRO family protein [Azospirillum melinis]MBP2310477.1 prophage antirepressor-like protein [Azospirillum melinis]NUB03763.1 hypothetical protein [Azospirillum melinis]
MSARLTPFLFEEEHLVRSVTDAGDPWFVIADVCRVLGISNHRDAASRLDDDEKGVGVFETAGGPQEMVIINEIGLYTLILRSHGAITPGTFAHRFRKWVAGEVLPSIRKTGAYAQKPRVDAPGQAHAIRLMKELKRQTDPVIRQTIHAMLADTLMKLNLPVPALDDLGRAGPQPSNLSIRFFAAVAAAGGLKINHARDPRLLAVNMGELNRHASAGAFAVEMDLPMRRALKADPRYRGARTIRSAIDPRRTLKCWLFAHDE